MMIPIMCAFFCFLAADGSEEETWWSPFRSFMMGRDEKAEEHDAASEEQKETTFSRKIVGWPETESTQSR